jgi:hypothetical protein
MTYGNVNAIRDWSNIGKVGFRISDLFRLVSNEKGRHSDFRLLSTIS